MAQLSLILWVPQKFQSSTNYEIFLILKSESKKYVTTNLQDTGNPWKLAPTNSNDIPVFRIDKCLFEKLYQYSYLLLTGPLPTAQRGGSRFDQCWETNRYQHPGKLFLLQRWFLCHDPRVCVLNLFNIIHPQVPNIKDFSLNNRIIPCTIIIIPTCIININIALGIILLLRKKF